MKIKDDTVYIRGDFPLIIQVQDDYLTVVHFPGGSYPTIVSAGKIAATNQSVVLLLKAFACPKLP